MISQWTGRPGLADFLPPVTAKIKPRKTEPRPEKITLPRLRRSLCPPHSLTPKWIGLDSRQLEREITIETRRAEASTPQ